MAETSVRERRIQELVRCCYRGLSAADLRAEVLRRLRTITTVDAAFFATVDPSTLLFTAATTDELLGDAQQFLLENEFFQDDVNKFTNLADSPDGAASLDHATNGDRTESRRYREILEPLGLGDELRSVLRVNGTTWGVMCLHREDSARGFDDSDAMLLAKLGPHIAAGFRHATTIEAIQTSDPTAPGVILLAPDLQVLASTPTAEALLGEIPLADWPRNRDLPIPVYAVAARLKALRESATAVPSLTLRASTGRWLTLHSSWMSSDAIAIVIEPAVPAETVPLTLLGYGLTSREASIAQLVIRGSSTKQIVNELQISAYTVQDHLKAVFDKIGVRSRRELTAQLLARH